MSVVTNICDMCKLLGAKICERGAQVLTKDCNERDDHPVSFSHFLPYTCFEDDEDFPSGVMIVDLSNQDQYDVEDNTPNCIRLKCLVLVGVTPILHAIGLVLNMANRIAKIVTFAHFWHNSTHCYSLSEKSWAFGKDVLRVAFSPIIYVGLELSALYGLILPNQGRKLYATFERCAYGGNKKSGTSGLVAYCFQPLGIKSSQ